MTLTNPVPAYS